MTLTFFLGEQIFSFFHYRICCSKNIPGVLKRKQNFGVMGAHCAPPPPGGHAWLENDTLLPLTMTHDWRKF